MAQTISMCASSSVPISVPVLHHGEMTEIRGWECVHFLIVIVWDSWYTEKNGFRKFFAEVRTCRNQFKIY